MTPGNLDVEDTIGDLTRLLTAIARRALRHHREPDVAPIVTGSLAAAVANVGGPECLLAGRPASRETACLRELLLGAMGECTDQRWILMTEAVTVSLTVAELTEDADVHSGLIGPYEAVKLDAAFGARSDEDQLAHAYEAAINDLDRWHANSYALYARRFVAAVESVAVDLNLPVPPQVLVDDDPQSARWDDGTIRKSADAESALVSELWERANAMVPLPNGDIRTETR